MKTVLIMTIIVFWVLVGLITSNVGYVVSTGSLGTLPSESSSFDITFLWNLATFQVQGLGMLSTFLLIFNIASIIFLVQLLRGD